MENNLDNIKSRLEAAKDVLKKSLSKDDPSLGTSGVSPSTVNPSAAMSIMQSGGYHKSEDVEKDELDEKIKNKIRGEMDKRGFGDKQTVDHRRDIDETIPAKQRSNIKAAVGKQTATKPKLKVIKDEDFMMELPETHKSEKCTIAKNGQWSIKKSGYGPKGAGLYSPADNAQRKTKNTGDVVADAGKNVNVKSYTTSGSSMSQASQAVEAKRQSAANKKAPVKTLKDMSPEEKTKLETQYGTNIKKSYIDETWENGKSFNDLLKKSLSDEEMAARNMDIGE